MHVLLAGEKFYLPVSEVFHFVKIKTLSFASLDTLQSVFELECRFDFRNLARLSTA